MLDLVVVSYYSSLRVQAGSALTEGDISNMLHAITNNTNFAHLGLRLNLQVCRLGLCRALTCELCIYACTGTRPQPTRRDAMFSSQDAP